MPFASILEVVSKSHIVELGTLSLDCYIRHVSRSAVVVIIWACACAGEKLEEEGNLRKPYVFWHSLQSIAEGRPEPSVKFEVLDQPFCTHDWATYLY